MKIKKLIIGLCSLSVLLSFFSSVSVYAQEKESEDKEYVVTTYNDRNGLPTGEANTILHSSDGYIWIGSYGGLIRYDGSEFRNYSLEGKIDSSSVRSLYEDSKGRLWIGTNDIGVICFEGDTFTAIDGPDDFSFLCIRDFVETSDGTIYVASNSGIAYIKDNTLVPVEDEHIHENTVYTIGVDSYNRIWCAMDSGKFAVVSDNVVLKIFESNEFFESEDVYSLTCKDDVVYLGTNSNIVAKLTLLGDSLETDNIQTELYYTGEVSTHNNISVTTDGDILISALNGFYVLFADGNSIAFDDSQDAVSVNEAVMDYEGNIWLASSSTGVIRYSKSYFVTPENNVLDGKSLNTISKAGDLYFVGSDDGLSVFDEEWNYIYKDISDELDGIRVRASLTDSDGNIWFATYAGVYCYNIATETITHFNQDNGILNDRTRALIELSDGSIAVGTQSGLNIIKDGNIIESYDSDDGLVNPSILCLYEAVDGTIYAGSDGDGIYAIKDGKIINHGFDEGLSEGVILRILPDSESDKFFVSAGSSLYIWEDNVFTKKTNWDKAAGSVFDMYDKNGRLWILQNNGVLSVDKEALISGEMADTITYSFNHGLTGSLNANTWHYLADDGKLYMVTRNGISIFGFEAIDNSEPKAVISSVVVDDVKHEHPTTLDISQKSNRITFNFAELSYSGTSTLVMEYQLINFDDEPILFGTDQSGSVSYTNLSGGDYTFVLKIYDPTNPEAGQSYTIKIHKAKKLIEYPAFWITVFALVIFCLTMIIYLFDRRKINRLKKHQEEYRDIIEQSLQTFAKTIDAKDTYTNGHSIRVAQYSRAIAKRLGLSEKEQERIYYLAMLHDIGKIGIPDNILTKPGKLTDEEMAIIQTHPRIGGEILKDFTALEGITEGAKYHHERYDGKGYGEGLEGENIPFVARIIGVADTYDAMSSDRCYRKALSREVIISELQNGKGTQFDPEIVSVMLQMIEDGEL